MQIEFSGAEFDLGYYYVGYTMVFNYPEHLFTMLLQNTNHSLYITGNVPKRNIDERYF